MENKNNMFDIFYCLIIERSKVQFKQGENYTMCTENMYWPNANTKIELQNFFPAISILSMHHFLEGLL